MSAFKIPILLICTPLLYLIVFYLYPIFDYLDMNNSVLMDLMKNVISAIISSQAMTIYIIASVVGSIWLWTMLIENNTTSSTKK